MLPFDFPDESTSYWKDTVRVNRQLSLNEDMHSQVTIVGAGITGLTLAYLLSESGYEVCLIDANEIFSGTTAYTTAKITNQHGLIYHELIENYGLELTELYYGANRRAMDFIKKTIQDLALSVELTNASSSLYTVEHASIPQLEAECRAYESLKIESHVKPMKELPFDTKFSLTMLDQYYFHPLKYLNGLLKACINQGVTIYENTEAVSVEYSKRPILITKNGHRIISQYLVQASHYPFFDQQLFFPLKMYADRSYVILLETDHTIENMYLSIDKPTHSFRPITVNDQPMMLLAGEDHRTGKSDLEMDEYIARLAKYADQHFKIKHFSHQWSAQDYTTIDKLPYVGRISKEKDNVFLATGFRKWGMTNGTNAALLIHDLIQEKDSPYQEVFDPNRQLALGKSLKTMVSFNIEVAKELVKGKWGREEASLFPLKKDEGKIIRYKGERVGIYKDPTGQIHAVDTTCTHLACELNWNRAEKSWDCPCHGSRFTYRGEVINGPAKKNLKTIELNLPNK